MKKRTVLLIGLEKTDAMTLRQNLGIEYIVLYFVRIMMIGKEYWQIKLTGDTWLKSIHNEGADKMEINPALLEDSKNIAKHFNMEIIGVDYMISNEGQPFLLEVNHIPNVTIFPFVNVAFLQFVTKWVKREKGKGSPAG